MSQPIQPSGRISNAVLVAKRRLCKLDQPVQLSFNSPWKKGNDLYDWYERRGSENSGSPMIGTIQLRKERESPFFHEYIAFSLQEGGKFFRADRRQKRDENLPLNAIYTDGVDAHDTIDNISSLDDGSFGASDCLIEIVFKDSVRVHLMLLLKICRAIAEHQKSRVYTLQRYNCYFFAQTIIFCIICAVSNWDGTEVQQEASQCDNISQRYKSPNTNDPGLLSEEITGSPKEHTTSEQKLETMWTLSSNFDYDWNKLVRLARDVVQTSHFLTHTDNCTQCRKSQSLHRQRSRNSEYDRLKGSLSAHWNAVFHTYINRVHTQDYNDIVYSGIWKLNLEDKSMEKCDREISQDSDDIENKWREFHQRTVSELTTALSDLLKPTEECNKWDPFPDIYNSTGPPNIAGPFQRVVTEWEDEIVVHFASAFLGVKESLGAQVTSVCSQAHRAKITSRLDSFKDSMVIKQVKDRAAVTAGYETKPMEDLTREPDLRRPPLLKRMGDAVVNLVKKSKYGPLQEVQVTEMQEFLEALIRAHSVRVEQYKYILKCEAKEVEGDLQNTMNEVWTRIIG